MAGPGARRPLQVAIVGSGPSGFHAADALFRSGRAVCVDMYERLPTPFGLVRGGVSPDHPKTKSVTRVYERMAVHAGFSFWGNVTVGRDVSVDDLRAHYHCVVFACGAREDVRLGIPGERLAGSHSATEFMGWLNADPDYARCRFDLSGEVAVVVGQGNVALDVCRVLGRHVDDLRRTDISEHGLDMLARSRIREIHLLGRRGPVQARFLFSEVRELGRLNDCELVVDPSDLELNPASRIELSAPEGRNSAKNMAVLSGLAAGRLSGVRKRIRMRFLRSPVELKGEGRVEKVVLERNRLDGEPFVQTAKGTGEKEEIESGLLFSGLGYKGVAIPGVPFDGDRGVIPSEGGRVLDGGLPAPGLYAVGWIKRGATGGIGTNKVDSAETVGSLLSDLPGLDVGEKRGGAVVREQLIDGGVRVVGFDDWHRIDAAEIERGRARGKPREKFATVEEMLAILD